VSAGRTVASSRVETVTLMTPEMSNFGGSVHGGHVLRLVDQIAYACAATYSGQYCVTRSVDRVDFRVPVRVGELLTLRAQVNYVGRTSMEVGVRAEARDPRSGEARHTNSCYLTMVAVDEARRPAAVPALVCETDEDRRRFSEGALRRNRAQLLEVVEAAEEAQRRAVERSPLALLVLDGATGRVADANASACALLGTSEAELGARTLWELHPERERERARRLWEEASAACFAEGELVYLSARGELSLRVSAWTLALPGRSLVQQALRPA
jgi:PAS domain S-box-containing protein